MKSNTNFKNNPAKHTNHTQSHNQTIQTKSQNLVQMVKNTGGTKTASKKTFIASNPHSLQKRANRLRPLHGLFL